MNQHTNADLAPQIFQDISHNAMVEIALSDPKDKLTQEEKDVRYQWFEKGANYMISHVKEFLYRYNCSNSLDNDYDEGYLDGVTDFRHFIRKKLEE